MKRTKFKFRLQRLLDVREINERRARVELVRRQQVLTTERARLQEIIDEEVRIEEEATPKPGQAVDPMAQMQLRWQIDRLQEQAREQEHAVENAQRSVAEQQSIARKTRQDVKVLEKLKDRKREEHRLEQLYEEQVFLDDIANQAHVRKQLDLHRRTRRKARDAERALEDEAAAEMRTDDAALEGAR